MFFAAQAQDDMSEASSSFLERLYIYGQIRSRSNKKFFFSKLYVQLIVVLMRPTFTSNASIAKSSANSSDSLNLSRKFLVALAELRMVLM